MLVIMMLMMTLENLHVEGSRSRDAVARHLLLCMYTTEYADVCISFHRVDLLLSVTCDTPPVPSPRRENVEVKQCDFSLGAILYLQ